MRFCNSACKYFTISDDQSRCYEGRHIEGSLSMELSLPDLAFWMKSRGAVDGPKVLRTMAKTERAISPGPECPNPTIPMPALDYELVTKDSLSPRERVKVNKAMEELAKSGVVFTKAETMATLANASLTRKPESVAQWVVDGTCSTRCPKIRFARTFWCSEGWASTRGGPGPSEVLYPSSRCPGGPIAAIPAAFELCRTSCPYLDYSPLQASLLCRKDWVNVTSVDSSRSLFPKPDCPAYVVPERTTCAACSNQTRNPGPLPNECSMGWSQGTPAVPDPRCPAFKKPEGKSEEKPKKVQRPRRRKLDF